MLVVIINIPTKRMMVFGDKKRIKYAPIGAAITPPIINASTVFHASTPIKNINTPVLKKVTKNSAVFTVPITSFGEFPLSIRFEVTIGPQPPPPIESKNAPIKPNNGAYFQLLFLALIVRKLFIRI